MLGCGIFAIRDPADGGYSPSKEYDVGLHVRMPKRPRKDEWPWGYVLMTFFTGGRRRRQRFEVQITSAGFKDLAQAMMRADPEEAIKAFGAAMQGVPAIAKAAPKPALS